MLRKIEETGDQVISTEILLSIKEGEIPVIVKSPPGSLKKTRGSLTTWKQSQERDSSRRRSCICVAAKSPSWLQNKAAKDF